MLWNNSKGFTLQNIVRNYVFIWWRDGHYPFGVWLILHVCCLLALPCERTLFLVLSAMYSRFEEWTYRDLTVSVTWWALLQIPYKDTMPNTKATPSPTDSNTECLLVRIPPRQPYSAALCAKMQATSITIVAFPMTLPKGEQIKTYRSMKTRC
jgi:hypothetical protein